MPAPLPRFANISKFLCSSICIILLPIAGGCSGKIATSHTFSVPKAVIQKKLDGKFPLEIGRDEADAKLLIKASDPVVLLEDGKNQIGVQVNIVATPVLENIKPGPPGFPAPPAPPAPSFTGSVTVFGDIAYDHSTKTIHIGNPKVTSLLIDQLPEALTGPISRLAEKALADKFAEDPIPLDKDTLLDRAVSASLQSAKVENGVLRVQVGW